MPAVEDALQKSVFWALQRPSRALIAQLGSRFDFFRLELKLNFAEKILPWGLRKKQKQNGARSMTAGVRASLYRAYPL